MGESTPLLPETGGNGTFIAPSRSSLDAAGSSLSAVSTIFVVSQVGLLTFFVFGATYSEEDYDVKQYIAFRDIMAMLLLGFGYLMTFLKNYGLGAVGFTMMLSIFSMELNLLVELLVKYFYNSGGDAPLFPLYIGMEALIDAEFAAATLMITFGALLGRTSPLQLLAICCSQSIFYAVNKDVFVMGMIGAEDVGGSMTIHMFGAYFGLAVSYALGPPTDAAAVDATTGESLEDKVSDVLALIGTTILWVYWPSFVGATETDNPVNEGHCVVNTILALLASTTMTFYLSQKLHHGKFDPVHIANSTLAGGVAIGSAGRLAIGPGGAIVTGSLAGAASVYGYAYGSPYWKETWKIGDTCGVGNLHGYPSLVGALLSIVFCTMDADADFLRYGRTAMTSQMLAQLGGIASTLVISVVSGYGTGLLISPWKDAGTLSYKDAVWWHLEY